MPVSKFTTSRMNTSTQLNRADVVGRWPIPLWASIARRSLRGTGKTSELIENDASMMARTSRGYFESPLLVSGDRGFWRPQLMIRVLSPENLSARYQVTIPLERRHSRWTVLRCYHCNLLARADCVTSGTQVPRELQLGAFLAIHHGRDHSLFIAGTGTGKTLHIALNCIARRPIFQLSFLH